MYQEAQLAASARDHRRALSLAAAVQLTVEACCSCRLCRRFLRLIFVNACAIPPTIRGAEMSRRLQFGDLPNISHRSLLQIYGLGRTDPYYNNYNGSCGAGCVTGSIIAAVVFFGIAIALVLLLVCRIRKQRTAAQAQPYRPGGPNQQPQQFVSSGGAQQYPAPSAYGPGGPVAQQLYPQQQPSYPQQQTYNGGSASAPPTNFADPEARSRWEREQYEKYGEAGVVEGQPVESSGIQMTNTHR